MTYTTFVRSRHRACRVLLAASLVASFALVTPMGALAQGEFKIGLLAPFTGFAGFYGPIYETAARVAVEKINSEGGILGMPVKLFIEDDKFTPATTVEAAQKLIQRDRVFAVIGTVSGTATTAVIPHTERAKIPFIYVVEGIIEGCHKYGFGLGPTPEQKLGKWVPWIIDTKGAKTFYFVGNDYFYPRAMVAFVKKLISERGGRTVGEEYSPIGTSEWSTILTRAEAAKPDVFFNFAVGADSMTMTKQAQQSGLAKKVEWVVMPGNNSAYLPSIHDFSQGAYGVEVYSEKLDNLANREFVKRYRARNSSEWPIPEVGAAVYTAFHVVKAAAEKAKSVDGTKLAAAIGGVTLDAPQGKITIDPETHLTVYNVYLLQIKGKSLNVVKDFGVARPLKPC